jgi:hypothetical protein
MMNHEGTKGTKGTKKRGRMWPATITTAVTTTAGGAIDIMMPDEYAQCERLFHVAFDRCKESMSSEAVNDIEHWLAHGELEMAFESFCLSLVAEMLVLSGDVKSTLRHLAPALGVEKEGVFDDEFWAKTVTYLDET